MDTRRAARDGSQSLRYNRGHEKAPAPACSSEFRLLRQKQNDTQRVMKEALRPSPLQENLRVLTDEIGGRVPGTPALDRAVRWGADALKAAGADDVQVESYSIPHSWQEGATRVSITSPVQFDLRAYQSGGHLPRRGR